MRLEHQRRGGVGFDAAWLPTLRGVNGPARVALFEPRETWRRAYDGEPMAEEERAAWVLAKLAVVEGVGLEHEDEPRSRAAVAVGHALVR